MPPTASELDELLALATSGDASALAQLYERFRVRLEQIVRLRLDQRLQGRVDSADVVQETYLTVQRKFAEYAANPLMPFFLWIRLETLQKLVDVHRFHLGAKART